MARIIDYERVVRTLTRQGLTQAYPNGGAYQLSDATVTGYVTAPDPSIRPGFDVRTVDDLPAILTELWHDIGGPLWLTPAHHWAHELDHGGNGQAVLDAAGVTLDRPANLAHALELSDTDDVSAVLAVLFRHSDWFASFPGHDRPVVAMLHHHGQLWVSGHALVMP
ncbi:MAG: hypothetical protein AAF743_17205 [Planctomycetota bacterium]